MILQNMMGALPKHADTRASSRWIVMTHSTSPTSWRQIRPRTSASRPLVVHLGEGDEQKLRSPILVNVGLDLYIRNQGITTFRRKCGVDLVTSALKLEYSLRVGPNYLCR